MEVRRFTRRVMKRAVTCVLLLVSAGDAHGPFDPVAFEQRLAYRTGVIDLLGGQVRVDTGGALKFLDAGQTRHLMHDAWGMTAGPFVLGMLTPNTVRAAHADGWGAVLTLDAGGHVPERVVRSIRPADVLKALRAQAVRTKEPEGRAEKLLGWALKPKYDAASRTLVWGKTLRAGDASGDRVAYGVRTLGRRAVLQLDIVTSAKRKAHVERALPILTLAVRFRPGSRYEDHRAGDPIAVYGPLELLGGNR